MFIEFEKYPFKVTGISIDPNDPKNHYDDCAMVIDLKTDGNKDFRLIAVGDCCSTSVFREYEEHKFEEIVGKVIKSITEIDFNDDDFEEDEFGLYLTPHLLEITFTDDSKFKFMLVNYSNGYYDGWLELSLIDK